MATGPKSPNRVIKSDVKEESFWDKLGTLGRKKKLRESKYGKTKKIVLHLFQESKNKQIPFGHLAI